MPDTPKLQFYDTFAEWLKAVIKTRKLQHQELASLLGRKPQAVSKWLRGGKMEAEPLRKLAEWAQQDYGDLFAFMSAQPLPSGVDAKRVKLKAGAPDPDVERIKRKLEQLRGDTSSLSAIEALLDHQLEQQAKGRKTVRSVPTSST